MSVVAMTVRQERCQRVHGRHEVALSCEHHEVDRVEVGVAVEATTEIGAWIDGRQIFLAARTQEGGLSLAPLVGLAQAAEDVGHRYLVAQAAQEFVREEVWHLSSS